MYHNSGRREDCHLLEDLYWWCREPREQPSRLQVEAETTQPAGLAVSFAKQLCRLGCCRRDIHRILQHHQYRCRCRPPDMTQHRSHLSRTSLAMYRCDQAGDSRPGRMAAGLGCASSASARSWPSDTARRHYRSWLPWAIVAIEAYSWCHSY